jgi:DNA gyrase/topoisomerase IV subunit A
LKLKEKYGDERRTEMVHSSAEMQTEDFIEDEDVVITISREGYIKRTRLRNTAGRAGEVKVPLAATAAMPTLLSTYYSF